MHERTCWYYESIPWCRGYHVRFTRERTPVRSPVETFWCSGCHVCSTRKIIKIRSREQAVCCIELILNFLLKQYARKNILVL